MSITAGAISLVSKGPTVASLLATAATAGTAPYTYQWYKSTVTGFSPGGGNIIAGATALALNDTGLIPGTTYYYKLVATDAVPASVTYTQFAVVTLAPAQNITQFAQSPYLGMLDLRFNPDTIAAEIDMTQVGALSAGAAVKIVDSADGIPKVVGIAASTDQVFGFINYDIKSQAFIAGSRVELSQTSNVMYLYATTAIARGAQVSVDISTMGGVSALVTGNRIVGYAFDKAVSAGQLIRVKVSAPSFAVAP